MPVQLTYRTEERIGRAGADYDSNILDRVTRFAEVACRPGNLMLKGTVATSAGRGARVPAAPAAADPDGIIETLALAGTEETWDGVELDGVIGGDLMVPARNVVAVLNSHADWDASTLLGAGMIEIRGEDEYGNPQSEKLHVPDAGNVTRTGEKLFSKVTAVITPAGSGTNRTITVGTGTLLGPLTPLYALGLLRYDASHVVPDGQATEYVANDVLTINTKGRAWVEVEDASLVVDGAQVFVRLVAAGDEVVGSFLTHRDGTAAAPDAVPVIGMRFWNNGFTRNEEDLAIVSLDFPTR